VSEANIHLRKELENRIRFETLISDISARFVKLPSHEIDGEIDRALKQIMDFFEVQRCALLTVHENMEFVNVMHASYADGVEQVPKDINLADLYPWSYEQLIAKGLLVNVRRMTDLPPEADMDRMSWEAIGVKSNLAMPLFSSNGIRYLIVIHSVHKEYDWPEVYIQRLYLLGNIFVNALERRDAEYALQESESRLTLAAESAGAGLWKLDIDRQVFWATKKARELFSFAPDAEISVAAFLDMVHPDDRQRVRDTVQKGSRSQEETSIQYRIVGPDGKIRWVASRGRAHVDLNGQSDGFMGVSIDITENRRTEEEILRLREEYTHIARVSAMGELTASLAHELKQPLAAIRSNAQAALRFLSGDKPDIDELHEVLKDIIADNRRADDVIGKLRTLMRKSKPQITELDMRELVPDILPLVASHEAMRKITLSLELDEAIPLAAGDRIQIQQVILNLILNSTEALMSAKKESRLIVVRAYQQDAQKVVLSVKDNGPGIEAKALPHLFEAFYTTKQEGLGMGLAICRSIIEEHGGRLWAENNPDRGATFYFTLPIAKENSA